MGQLTAFIAILAFSLNSFAQIEFGPLIEDSINQQKASADDLHKSTLLASNVENDDSFDNEKTDPAKVDTVKAAPAEAPHAVKNEKSTAPSAHKVASEKDFTMKLHPTGRASAQRYFPPKPKVKKVAKHSKKSNGKIAKGNKSKKGKTNRSTASVKKAKHGKHPKTSQTDTSSIKI